MQFFGQLGRPHTLTQDSSLAVTHDDDGVFLQGKIVGTGFTILGFLLY